MKKKIRYEKIKEIDGHKEIEIIETKKSKSKLTLKQFLTPLTSDKRAFYLYLGGVFLSAGFYSYTTFVLTPIVDALNKKDWVTFQGFALSVLIIGFITIMYLYITRDSASNMLKAIEQNINSKYLTKFLYLENTYVDREGIGKFSHIVEKGASTWGNLGQTTIDMTRTLLFTLGSLVNVVIISKPLFAFFIVGISIIFYVTYKYNGKINYYRDLGKEAATQYSRNLVKIISSKFVILQNGGVEKEVRLQNKKLDDYYDVFRNSHKYIERINLSIRLFILALRIAVLGYVGYLAYKNLISAGELVTLISVVGVIEITLTFLISGYVTFIRGYVNVTKLEEVVGNGPTINGFSPDSKPFTFVKGDIDMRNIYLKYHSKEVFKDFNFFVKGGEKVAIIGKSGAGKSSLIKLITGFIQPDSGSISIDGQDLAGMGLSSYYESLGYITQEPLLFDGTVAENVDLSGKKTKNEIELSLELAGCDFVKSFKNGIDEQVGEKGSFLSGGEKQRLILARMFLKNPDILILDEPTSALDSASEEKFREGIHNLMIGRTVIMITHKPEIVEGFDKIYTLSHNTIHLRGKI